jgi:hypothetical protein
LGRIPTATDQSAGAKFKRHFRNYLLDKSLQLRYVVFVAVLSAVISGSLGFLIWQQEADASDKILETLSTSHLGDDPELAEAIDDRLNSHDTNLVLTMAGFGLGMMIVLSLYLIVMTHKVAGPIFKVSAYFDIWAKGQLHDVWNLRKGDMLVEFYDKFKGAHTALRERHSASNDLVARFVKACEDAGVESKGESGHVLDEAKAFNERRTEALS